MGEDVKFLIFVPVLLVIVTVVKLKTHSLLLVVTLQTLDFGEGFVGLKGFSTKYSAC